MKDHPLSRRAVDANPVLVTAAGAMFIASSGILVRLAATTPETVALFRCAYALPLLALITRFETKRSGPLAPRSRNLAWIAGVFFAIDLIFWHHAINYVGAGLATVLGNLQVLIVGFVAWGVLSERPSGRMFWAIPIVLVGVVLISGAVGGDAYGENPALGVVFGAATSVAYAAFILILREGARDLQRVAGPLSHATASSILVAAIYGVVFGDIEWVPEWPSHGWLVALALSAQVAGWLLISRSLPQIPAALASIILLLQPVGAMAIAYVVLAEQPSIAQLGGASLILAGVVVAASGHRRPAAPEEAAPAPVASVASTTGAEAS